MDIEKVRRVVVRIPEAIFERKSGERGEKVAERFPRFSMFYKYSKMAE